MIKDSQVIASVQDDAIRLSALSADEARGRLFRHGADWFYHYDVRHRRNHGRCLPLPSATWSSANHYRFSTKPIWDYIWMVGNDAVNWIMML